MKKIKLLPVLALTALLAHSCTNAYDGTKVHCKIINTTFLAAHVTYTAKRLHSYPDIWKVNVLKDGEVIEVRFKSDPFLKADSVYNFLILE